VGEDDGVDSQHGERADQPEFLGEHREDEVCLLFRQEIEVALRALQQPLAEQATRAQCDL
jgi:hypothetical protein